MIPLCALIAAGSLSLTAQPVALDAPAGFAGACGLEVESPNESVDSWQRWQRGHPESDRAVFEASETNFGSVHLSADVRTGQPISDCDWSEADGGADQWADGWYSPYRASQVEVDEMENIPEPAVTILIGLVLLFGLLFRHRVA